MTIKKGWRAVCEYCAVSNFTTAESYVGAERCLRSADWHNTANGWYCSEFCEQKHTKEESNNL